MKVVKTKCGKCGYEYEVNLEEVPIDDNFVKDICPNCNDDEWKKLEEIK